MKKSLIVLLIIVTILLIINSIYFRMPMRQQYLPPAKPVPPPEMIWDIKTDFSVLTQYVPQSSMFTRLHDGSIPELIPSNDYGVLLPYASTSVMPNGVIRASKYGFVTIDGLIVTDMIYESISRAYYHIRQRAEPLPAYRLAVDWEYGHGMMYAACALDGSWITPFDYVDVIFTEEVIILARNYVLLDVDVYDYDGNLLYNMRQKEWVNDISGDIGNRDLFHSVYEGYGYVRLQYGGSLAFIDLLTGQATYTGYLNAQPFSEGFAPVSIIVDNPETYNRLWGYINKDFKLVLKPVYMHAYEFIDGKALVCTEDNIWHVINTDGEILLSSSPGEFAYRYNDSGFVFRPDHDKGLPRYYTSDLSEIKLPEAVNFAEDYVYIHELSNGWLGYQYDNGFYLFNLEEEHFFSDIESVVFTDGEYVVYHTWHDWDDSGSQMGVLTIDGRDILPLQSWVSVAVVSGDNGTEAFMENDAAGHFSIYSQYRANYHPVSYRLYNTNGQIIASGPGILSYDEALELYSVLGPDYFAWLDTEGNTFISIPLMSYILD